MHTKVAANDFGFYRSDANSFRRRADSKYAALHPEKDLQDATSAMNQKIGGWNRSFYAEGNEGLTPLPDCIQIKIHIVRADMRRCDDR